MKSPVKDYIQKKYGIDLLEWKPQIKGSPIKAKHINKILNFDLNEVIRGIEVEHEHTSDPIIAMEIAFAHILELKDYYVRLDRMEEEGKKELGIKEDINQNSKESKMKRQDVLTAYNYLMRQKEVLSEETFELKYGERLEKIEAIMESEDMVGEGASKVNDEIARLKNEITRHKMFYDNLKYTYEKYKKTIGNNKSGYDSEKKKKAEIYKRMIKYKSSIERATAKIKRLRGIKEDMVGEAVEFHKSDRMMGNIPSLSVTNKNLMLVVAYVIADAPEKWNITIMDTKDDYQPIDAKDNPISFKTINEVIRYANKKGFKISNKDFVKFLDVM